MPRPGKQEMCCAAGRVLVRFSKGKEVCDKVRKMRGGHCRSRRESPARARLLYRGKFVVCWGFGLATDCCLRVMRRGYGCGLSGRRARSLGIEVSGTPGLVRA